MRIKSYIFISILLFLFSCAEEGPFTFGKWDYSLENTKVSYTTAELTIKIPISANNIMTGIKLVYLVNREYHHPDGIPQNQRIYGTITERYEGYVASFQKLAPNTTYYVVIEPDSNVDGLGVDICPTLYTGYSFTTLAITEDNLSSIVNDIEIEIPDISYTTADLTVNVTKVNSLIKDVEEVYLVNREFHYPEMIPDNEKIKPYHFENRYNTTNEEYYYLSQFKNLTPNTTYYLVIKPVWNTNLGITDTDRLLYTDFSFTTPMFSEEDLSSMANEITIATQKVSYTTADLQITIPEDLYNLTSTITNYYAPAVKSIFLVERRFHYPEDIPESERINASIGGGQRFYSCRFRQLAPNTTYYLVIEPAWNTNSGLKDSDRMLYTSYSVTTSSYDFVNKIQFRKYRETNSWTYIEVVLPNDLDVKDVTLSASVSPGMSDKDTQPKNQGTVKAPIFQFNRFERKKYYFQLEGFFSVTDGEGYYAEVVDLGYKEIDLGSIDFSDIEN